ncbi:uncharacterized protein LOC111270050 isoform X1 [Varroa jacobsoni]|uniref:uncharacterized protein LOC111270050 isoform X1 n=1 Tax=Varroa jacobsoni TaxID=62625 RepID=UPI000BF8C3D6|nr:uncharacterized protein LOC111270050 isoform X1 [Varroa jacobsoni]
MFATASVLLCAIISLGFGNTYASPYETGRGHRRMEITTLIKPKSPSRLAFRPSLRPDYVPTFEANRHYEDMQERTKCHSPRPVVIEVQKDYSNASIEYLPSCTILHRCDSQSGCCGHGRTCQAQRKELVDLYFYVIPADRTQKHGSDILKLSFTNHSVCACEEDLVPEDIHAANPSTPSNSNDNANETFDDIPDEEFIPEHRCKRCPEPFAERVLKDFQCTCDCFDQDVKCTAIKKGRKRMPQTDVRCVRTGDCGVPQCSTGSFDARKGRCPLLTQRKYRHARQRGHRFDELDKTGHE